MMVCFYTRIVKKASQRRCSSDLYTVKKIGEYSAKKVIFVVLLYFVLFNVCKRHKCE